MYLLEFTEGPRAGQKLILRKTRATLGRAEEADVFLDGAEISRQHAEIELQNNRAYLLDLDALNPVRVNGEPVKETELRDEDLIQVGFHQALYRRIIPPMPLLHRPLSLLQRCTSGAVGLLLLLQLGFLLTVSLLWRQTGLPLVRPTHPPVATRPAPVPGDKPKVRPDKPAPAVARAPTDPSDPAAVEPSLIPPRPVRPEPVPVIPEDPEVAKVPLTANPPPVPTPMPTPAVPTPTPVTPTPPVVVAVPPTPLDQALQDFAKGDFIGAEQSVARALKENARNGEALALKARILDRQGKFRESQLTWETLLAVSETPALSQVARVESERLGRMVRLLNQSQAMADRVRAEERNSPLQVGTTATPEPTPPVPTPRTPPPVAPAPAAPVVAATPRPAPLSTRSVLLESAQIERLVSNADVEDMRMLTINLKVDPAASGLRGEDVRIKTVFYDQNRQNRRVEPSAVTVLEANATLSGTLRPSEQISITRPYVVPSGFRKVQQERSGKSMSFYGFMIEIYYRDRLLQQYARPSSLLGS